MKPLTESRSYRISTQIRNSYGVKIEKLQTIIRTDCGKKLKICEVIEIAIDELESSYDLGKTKGTPY